MTLKRIKERGMDDAKEEEGEKRKRWIEEEEEDKTYVFHQKYTRIRRPFGSRYEEFGRYFLEPQTYSLSRNAVNHYHRGGDWAGVE